MEKSTGLGWPRPAIDCLGSRALSRRFRSGLPWKTATTSTVAALRYTINVLINAEEQHIPARQVGTPMALAGNIGQAFENIHQSL